MIADNATAVLVARATARALGYDVEEPSPALVGEAARAGRDLARTLLDSTPSGKWASIRGGETTVALPTTAGLGGRSQELALAAAELLGQHQAGRAPIVLLAAGTDGRDGPTDAAGALVDGTTWPRVAEAGVDPSTALDRHDAYRALDAAGALLRTGPTGTNVMDLTIGLVEPIEPNRAPGT